MIITLIIVLSPCYKASFANNPIDSTLITVPLEIDKSNINDLEIYSDCVLMMERSTGNILYDRNGNNKMYPASTTKILTAILVLENCDLDEMAEVTSLALNAVPATYTTCNIRVGEKFTVKDLLYTMLIRSANDAANVLAIHVSGSITEFSELMNKKAKAIGCTDSHFTNPSGIHDEELYTSARDLALIADYAMNNETFRKIVMTPTYTLPATAICPNSDRTFVISNSLVNPNDKNYYYEYATGIKTGYTNASKDCVVASAKKDGIEFIVVVLGSDKTSNGLRQKYLDCKTLFNFAFDNYTIYYKELQAKREEKFNPFLQFFNNLTNKNEEVNTAQSLDIEVATNPVEMDSSQIPDIENLKYSSISFTSIIFLSCFIIIILSIVILNLIKKNRIKSNRGRRRKLR